MESISSNHYSVDIQTVDALAWLESEHPAEYAAVVAEFPEYADHRMDGAWFDTDAMSVEVEFGSWLADAVEATGLVTWVDGEPFVNLTDSDDI